MSISAARSTGSRCRYGSSGHSSGFAWARRCSPGSLAPGWRRTRKAVRRSAITRSARRRRASNSVPMAGSCLPLAPRGIRTPPRRELLAEGSDFPVEAFRLDHAFGLQFHPDVTYAMMHRWTTRGHARLELPGARPRHHHFADRAVHDATERAWLSQFIDDWLARTPIPAMAEAANSAGLGQEIRATTRDRKHRTGSSANATHRLGEQSVFAQMGNAGHHASPAALAWLRHA